MKVILTEDIDSLGLEGQVVDVARGHARNKLIPGKLAVEATSGNMKAFEKARTEFTVRSLKEKERAEQFAKEIEEISLTISQKAGEKGKLYGSVTSIDLAQAMAEQGIELDRRKIKLPEPIKALGDFDVPVRLQAEVTAIMKVSVIEAEE
ncbi:MAG: 50S ribosomal protein L9 [Deltaproteobacteria bacterium]|nr:50S ribosomal protein L9 [Deltaproteobacteria bacterium]